MSLVFLRGGEGSAERSSLVFGPTLQGEMGHPAEAAFVRSDESDASLLTGWRADFVDAGRGMLRAQTLAKRFVLEGGGLCHVLLGVGAGDEIQSAVLNLEDAGKSLAFALGADEVLPAGFEDYS